MPWFGNVLRSGAALLVGGFVLIAQPPKITSFDRAGRFTVTNLLTSGVATFQTAGSLSGPWTSQLNLFTTNRSTQTSLTLPGGTQFVRVGAADISGTPAGFNNFVRAYGLLSTVAGSGNNGTVDANYWLPQFEGGSATDASLSRPHHAIADRAGNIYIVDKDSHSVLKVTTDGKIRTVAGNHIGGFNGEGPLAATNLQLNLPNGLYVRSDGQVYILDTSNGRVRRLTTNGMMSTVFYVGAGNNISGGRGLWVRDDEALIYFCDGNKLRRWTPSAGVKTVNNGFTDLGNIAMDLQGRLVITDRGANRVYRLNSDDTLTVIAGNGETSGGGDGSAALSTGLWGVRGVWYLPNGGYVLGTHEGSQVWYVDPSGIIHLLLDGLRSWHGGDGFYFYDPGLKISEARSVSVAPNGDILIVENDLGYVRKIQFLPMP